MCVNEWTMQERKKKKTKFIIDWLSSKFKSKLNNLFYVKIISKIRFLIQSSIFSETNNDNEADKYEVEFLN